MTPDTGELFRCCRDVEIWAGGRVVRASLTGVTWAEDSSVVECISMQGKERRRKEMKGKPPEAHTFMDPKEEKDIMLKKKKKKKVKTLKID